LKRNPGAHRGLLAKLTKKLRHAEKKERKSLKALYRATGMAPVGIKSLGARGCKASAGPNRKEFKKALKKLRR
jgi:hypothetical protein